VTSGWWGVVRNRKDSRLDHHHTTRGFVDTVNRNLNGAEFPILGDFVETLRELRPLTA